MRRSRAKTRNSLSLVKTTVLTLGVLGLFVALGASTMMMNTKDAIAAATGGSGGQMTDQTDQSFTGSQYTSEYHLYASGLDTSKPIGMLIYGDGSGESGLKSPTGDYLIGGSNGLASVAKKHNMVLLTPLSPNKSCSDGDGSCWYQGDSEGYTKWAEELVLDVQKRYNIDTDRIAFGGYSSGAQLATRWWVPSGAAQRTMTDGVIVAISYGGSPAVDDTTTEEFRQKVHMSWDVGQSDPSYTGGAGVTEGHDYYKGKGFSTSLNVVDGDHGRSGEFGDIMDREITAHVPAGGTGGTAPQATTATPDAATGAEATDPTAPSAPTDTSTNEGQASTTEPESEGSSSPDGDTTNSTGASVPPTTSSDNKGGNSDSSEGGNSDSSSEGTSDESDASNSSGYGDTSQPSQNGEATEETGSQDSGNQSWSGDGYGESGSASEDNAYGSDTDGSDTDRRGTDSEGSSDTQGSASSAEGSHEKSNRESSRERSSSSGHRYGHDRGSKGSSYGGSKSRGSHGESGHYGKRKSSWKNYGWKKYRYWSKWY